MYGSPATLGDTEPTHGGERACRIVYGPALEAHHFLSSFTVQNSVTWPHLIEEAGKCRLAVGPGEKGNGFGERITVSLPYLWATFSDGIKPPVTKAFNKDPELFQTQRELECQRDTILPSDFPSFLLPPPSSSQCALLGRMDRHSLYLHTRWHHTGFFRKQRQ